MTNNGTRHAEFVTQVWVENGGANAGRMLDDGTNELLDGEPEMEACILLAVTLPQMDRRLEGEVGMGQDDGPAFVGSRNGL